MENIFTGLLKMGWAASASSGHSWYRVTSAWAGKSLEASLSPDGLEVAEMLCYIEQGEMILLQAKVRGRGKWTVWIKGTDVYIIGHGSCQCSGLAQTGKAMTVFKDSYIYMYTVWNRTRVRRSSPDDPHCSSCAQQLVKLREPAEVQT